MNARSYRVNLIVSPLDFPAITGLGESEIFFFSEPVISNEKMLLMITKSFVLLDVFANKKYEVLTAQSLYEIPTKEIKPEKMFMNSTKMLYQH